MVSGGRPSRGRRCVIGGAVPWGLVGRGVMCVALCRGIWQGGRRVGGAVPWNLAGRASCGWRCAVIIGREGVVWVALHHCDWHVGRCVGGAVPLGLVGGACGQWRC